MEVPIPFNFLELRAKSIQQVCSRLLGHKILTPHHFQGRVLNCGAFVGSSHCVTSGAAQAINIEPNKQYISWGQQMDNFSGEVIQSDALSYLASAAVPEFDLITFFGMPNNFPLRDFSCHGYGRLAPNGRIVVTGFDPLMKRDLSSSGLYPVEIEDVAHWDMYTLVGGIGNITPLIPTQPNRGMLR